MIFLRRAPEYDPHPVRYWFRTWTSGWHGAFVLLVLTGIGIGFWKGSEIYYGIKVWRTERLIAESEAARERGDDSESAARLRQATALLQWDPLTLRAVARYQAEMRDPSVLATCAEILKTGHALVEDRVFFATQAFRQDRADLAGPIFEELRSNPAAGNNAGLLAMEAGELGRQGRWTDALRVARQATAGSGSDYDVAFAKLVLARMLVQPPLPDQNGTDALRSEGIAMLMSLARRVDVTGLEAMEALIGLSQNGLSAPLFVHQDVRALLETLGKRPHASPALRVGCWSLLLAAEPENKAAITQEFYERFSKDPNLRLEAARWLNQNGMHQMALEIAAPAKFDSEDWFALYLDANAALGNWEEVFRRLTATDRKIPLPAALRKLFELRAAIETGRHPSIPESWLEIMRATRLETPEHQLYVAGYAEQMGYPAEAAQIFMRLLDESRILHGVPAEANRQRRLACYSGLLRTGARAMTLKELSARVSAFAAEFPGIDEVQNDDAYLQLLSGGDTEKAARTAERLLQKRPQLLAYRTTLALSALRRQKPQEAAALYEGWKIDWSTAQDQYKAVYAAVMRAAGRLSEADAVGASINPGALRPEERLLAGLP